MLNATCKAQSLEHDTEKPQQWDHGDHRAPTLGAAAAYAHLLFRLQGAGGGRYICHSLYGNLRVGHQILFNVDQCSGFHNVLHMTAVASAQRPQELFLAKRSS
jgi:hypothetical protein